MNHLFEFSFKVQAAISWDPNRDGSIFSAVSTAVLDKAYDTKTKFKQMLTQITGSGLDMALGVWGSAELVIKLDKWTLGKKWMEMACHGVA